jgi:two-component system, cell cycle response regulator CtrA
MELEESSICVSYRHVTNSVRIASLSRGDARVRVTGKEYLMLELLAMRKGSTLTKEMFLSHLYGGMDEPEMKIIDVFICKLRKKLSDASGGRHYIETVWGRGYVSVSA